MSAETEIAVNRIPEAATTDPFIEQTQALCRAILDRPDFAGLRGKIDAFMGDELSKFQYQMLNERAGLLQQKQGMGVALTTEEIAQFEAVRDTFMKNTVGRDFLDAQEQLQKIQESVVQYIHKTFELGRVPAPEDFQSCCSSSGCGCGN
jgi:cell fate (sporulation/competence/biofilm development) regulator YlbF (YheA/YmcA/DUF963 family)